VPSRQAVLAERYRDALIDVRNRVSTRVDRTWRDLGSWDEADVARFQSRVLPVVQAGQRRTVALTDAYLARATRTRPVGLVADDLIGAAVRNGTDPADVYRRPFVQLWSALSNGARFMDAMNAAGVRAAQSASTDVSLTMRASADAFDAQAADEARIVGWERVLDPDACAYCATASTQRYRSANLDPLHANCQCGIAPVFAENDRAIKDFNRQVLSNIKDANAGADRPYWEARHFRVDGTTGEVILPDVAVHEHGELGAVLADAAHDFTPQSALPG
jgi:hypothetical protein